MHSCKCIWHLRCTCMHQSSALKWLVLFIFTMTCMSCFSYSWHVSLTYLEYWWDSINIVANKWLLHELDSNLFCSGPAQYQCPRGLLCLDCCLQVDQQRYDACLATTSFRVSSIQKVWTLSIYFLCHLYVFFFNNSFSS